MHAESAAPQSKWAALMQKYAEGVQLMIGVGGIYSCFLLYSWWHKEITSHKGADGARMSAWLLMVIEALANVILGYVCMIIFEGSRFKQLSPRSIQVPYLISGSVQVGAKWSFTAALLGQVAFPVATLAKSSKMVPVMVGQLLVGKASYGLRDYVQVGLICAGTTIVGLATGHGGKGKDLDEMSTIQIVLPYLLLVMSLTCDGIVGGYQKKLKGALKEAGMKERNFEMQFVTNSYMCLVAILGMIVSGELMPGLHYLEENTDYFGKILKFAVCSACGQAFIFYTIKNFDSLVCTTVTTTRKVFTVLISVIFAGDDLNEAGWAGLLIACSGILGELEHKYSASQKKVSNGGQNGRNVPIVAGEQGINMAQNSKEGA